MKTINWNVIYLLMYHLLKAIPKESKIIMIGDINQLASVGAVNVFKGIINQGNLKRASKDLCKGIKG